jgi:hypothetical protein
VLLPDSPSWQAAAACAGLPPTVVFARRPQQAAPALRACTVCTVRRECEQAVAPAESFFDGVCAGRLWRNGRPVTPRRTASASGGAPAGGRTDDGPAGGPAGDPSGATPGGALADVRPGTTPAGGATAAPAGSSAARTGVRYGAASAGTARGTAASAAGPASARGRTAAAHATPVTVAA